jgi:hypothetical protein
MASHNGDAADFGARRKRSFSDLALPAALPPGIGGTPSNGASALGGGHHGSPDTPAPLPLLDTFAPALSLSAPPALLLPPPPELNGLPRPAEWDAAFDAPRSALGSRGSGAAAEPPPPYSPAAPHARPASGGYERAWSGSSAANGWAHPGGGHAAADRGGAAPWASPVYRGGLAAAWDAAPAAAAAAAERAPQQQQQQPLALPPSIPERDGELADLLEATSVHCLAHPIHIILLSFARS